MEASPSQKERKGGEIRREVGRLGRPDQEKGRRGKKGQRRKGGGEKG